MGNGDKRLYKAIHIKGFLLPTATPKPRAEGSSTSAPAKNTDTVFTVSVFLILEIRTHIVHVRRLPQAEEHGHIIGYLRSK